MKLKSTLQLLVATTMLARLHVCAEEPKVPPANITFHFLDINLLDALGSYSKWTGRKVWVAMDLFPTINIQGKADLPRREAVEFFRTTLLERYGVELRDSGDKEAFADWSADPKYKDIQDAARKGPAPKPAPANPARQRVRVIER